MDWRRWSRRLHRDERGATLVFVTLMFTVLLGFVAMVSDVGVAYANRRWLQNAVDAAALAGGEHLPGAVGCDMTTPPLQTAVQYAGLNFVPASELIDCGTDATFGVQVTTTFNTGDTIIVSARRTIPFGMRYILGMGDQDVVASARAIVAATAPNHLAPWAVTEESLSGCGIGTVCDLRLGNQSDSFAGGGNFYALDFPASSGANGYTESIEYGWNGGVPTPNPGPPPPWDWNVDTETGAMAGPTRSSVNALFDLDATKNCNQNSSTDPLQDCSSHYVMDPTHGSSQLYADYEASSGNGEVCYDNIACARVVVIPIIDTLFTTINGKKTVKVLDFGCFYVRNRLGGSDDVIRGVFVDLCRNVGGTPIYGGGLDNKSTTVLLWQ